MGDWVLGVFVLVSSCVQRVVLLPRAVTPVHSSGGYQWILASDVQIDGVKLGRDDPNYGGGSDGML